MPGESYADVQVEGEGAFAVDGAEAGAVVGIEADAGFKVYAAFPGDVILEA